MPLEKWSRVWGTRNAGGRGGGDKLLNKVVGIGLIGKVAFEQRPEGSEGPSHVEIGDKTSSAERESGPGRTCLVVREQQGGGKAGVGHVRETGGGHQVRRLQRPDHRREAM